VRTSQLPRGLPRFALSGVLALAPAMLALPAAHAADPAACAVITADAVWGFKESFRSYVSGTIANGRWETTGAASYETPNFAWTGGTGWYDPQTGTGSIAFAGGIRFTGHGGLLDTTVQNPTLVLTGPRTAQVLLDVSGVSMEDALSGGTERDAVTQVPFIDVDLANATTDSSDAGITIAVSAAPTTITTEGFAVFGGYEAGSAFDPIALTVSAACPPAETAPPAPSAPVGAEAAATDAAADAGPGWIPGAVGGLLTVVVAVAGFAFTRRGRTGGGTGAGGAA